MRVLELFCGTKSVGKVCEANGFEVVSLDFQKKFNPTICEDITTWEYSQYPPNHFDMIWASPDCSTFSIASSGKYRLKEHPYGRPDASEEIKEACEKANLMIKKTLEIIDYFQPKYWFIENPRGILQYYPPLQKWVDDRGMKHLVYYGNWGWEHPKPTNIWSNVPLWNEKKPDMSPDHEWTNIHGQVRRTYKSYSHGSAKTRSAMPPLLICEFLKRVDMI